MLDEKTLANLKSANLKRSPELLKDFQRSLGLEIDCIAVIEKCNAVMILISYQEDLALDFVKGRLLMTWDNKSYGGIINLIRDIKIYQNIEAVKFLGECAAGIHSVTIGDSQVLSQIVDSLNSGIQNEKNVLRIVSDWIRDTVDEVKLKTQIFDGNLSLERIACELIVKNSNGNKLKTLIFGFGKTGKLVAKILSKENSIPLSIINRTQIDISGEDFKKSEVSHVDINRIDKIDDISNLVIAVDNNPDTALIIDKILSRIKRIDTLFCVDLSTPSLLRGKVVKYVDIEYLSNFANENSLIRRNEVNKVKEIVNKRISNVIDALNGSVAKQYINNQKKVNFKKLDFEKLNLAQQRNEMYKTVRSHLEKKNFIEVTTPYIVGISTDPPKVDRGGTINVEWMNGATAFLRQSNQIYKQILVASGMERIYEIGPFWRQETSESYRHLQESMGLDIEMKNPSDLSELYFLACEIIKKTSEELCIKMGLESKLVLPEIKNIPVLTYKEAIKLLQENGNPVTMGDDLGLVSEARLGQIIKKKNSSDIFVIKDYPDTIKKFYTKNKPEGLTETFDIIVNGWELVSGAIRQVDGEQIKKSMSLSGIDVNNYMFYISIVDKAVEHGGFCIGLDRLMAKILDKEMVSDAVLFPRTYKRLIP